MKLVTNCVLMALCVSGCSTIGSLNPFGQSEQEAPVARGEGGEVIILERQVRDGSVLLPSLRSSRLDADREGKILVVETIMPIQGYYDSRLYRRNFGESDENGILHYEFRAKRPIQPTTVGPERTRIVQAADFISNGDLRDVTEIHIKTQGQVYRIKP